MLKSIHRAGLAAALLLAASPVAAHPFDSFVKMCVNTSGAAAPAAGAARSAGWTQMPREALGETDAQFRDPVAFMNINPATLDPARPPETIEVLVTGWGSGADILGIPELTLEVCGVMSPNVTGAELERRMSAMVNQPVTPYGEFRVWLYSRDGDRFVSENSLFEADDATFAEAARQRQIYAVYMMTEGDLAGLLVGAIRNTQ
jgi:hypothetical protein